MSTAAGEPLEDSVHGPHDHTHEPAAPEHEDAASHAHARESEAVGAAGTPVAHAHDRGREHAPGHDHPHPHPHPHEHDHDHAGAGLSGFLSGLFHPHSHDAADSVDQALEGSGRGIQALQISLVGLLLTAAIQLAVVLLSGSAGLLADTIHNFADALTAVPLWIAFVLGRRAANRRYTYGYGRAEDVAGVLIVLVILASAILAAVESIQRLMHPVAPGYLGVVAIAAVVGFAGNELVALYRVRVGQAIGSAALVADGYHARADGLTSLGVLIGVGGSALGVPVLDPLVGLAITVAILLITRDAARSIWQRLMDAVDPTYVDRLERLAAGVDGVEAVTSVRARWTGHRMDADLTVVVDASLSTAASHAIAERVRHVLFHQDPRLSNVLVHTDPSERNGEDFHAETADHTRRGGATA